MRNGPLMAQAWLPAEPDHDGTYRDSGAGLTSHVEEFVI
jgi:hypothetical protein